MKYRIDRDVENASGTQTYEVEASSKEDALVRFNNWEGDVVYEEVELDPSGNDVTLGDVYEAEEE